MEPTGTSLQLGRLSPAERRVFDLALTGRSTQGIADELVITEATVRSHLTRIYAKLEVRGRIDLLGHVASQHDGETPTYQELEATTSGGLPPWALIVIAAGAVLIGVVIPLSSFLLSPSLLVPGLLMRRRTPPKQRWRWMVVVGSGSVLGIEALLLVALLGGLSSAAP